MKMLLWNLLLALVWTAMSGDLTLANLLIGFVLGYGVLLLGQRVIGTSSYFVRVYRVLGFGLFILWELLLANLRVAHDIVTPSLYMRPGVIAVPLDAATDTEITLLANLLTLTPGSLSLDISDDCRVLYIHAMFIGDPETFRQQIKQRFERRLLEILR